MKKQLGKILVTYLYNISFWLNHDNEDEILSEFFRKFLIFMPKKYF